MMFIRLTVLAIAATSLCVFFGRSDAIAQEPVIKEKPKNVPSHAEDGEIKVGEKITMTKLVKQSDGSRKKVKVERTIPEQKWKIGVVGWHDKEGCNIIQFKGLRDVETDKMVDCPLKAVRLMTPSGTVFTASLIKGDEITLIDGFEVPTMTELIVAINSASDPKKLEIEVINSSTGKVSTGQITAVKVKK
jgi:hypothetical protein